MEINPQIPDVLYQQIENLSQKENIPINELINMALSVQISAWMTEDYSLRKAKKGSWEKFNQVLDKVSDREPEEYDMFSINFNSMRKSNDIN